MTERTITYADWRAPPELRKALVAVWRRKRKAKFALSNALVFWRICGQRVCQRRHACSDNPDACFTRQWARRSGDAKAGMGAFFDALAAGLSYERALAAADAGCARHAALMAELAALRQRAAVQPAPAETPPAALSHTSLWRD